MDIYHTIVRPLVTEKSTTQAQRSTEDHGPTYAFEVHTEASKPQIRDAVEKIYGVKVMTVRTLNSAGRRRRFRFRYGQTSATKKAFVTVNKDSHIDLF